MADAGHDQSGHARALDRSLRDLRALTTHTPDGNVIAAGIPWYVTVFGRDSLVTSLQTLPFYPAIAIATLEALASLQSESDDPWRDAEPGKIAHELRTGELARAGVLPFSPYYGTADATPLWLVLLAETCAWTGDLELARRLWPNALRALEWIDRYGDHRPIQ